MPRKWRDRSLLPQQDQRQRGGHSGRAAAQMRLIAAASVPRAQAEMVASMSVDAVLVTDMTVLGVILLALMIFAIAHWCLARN